MSDVSIEGSVTEDASITEEYYDDVEYAPPTATGIYARWRTFLLKIDPHSTDPKYDPGFDMPDYKEVGATLMSIFGQSTIPDDYDPVSDFDGADLLKDIGPLVWGKLELPDICVFNISLSFPYSPCVFSTKRYLPIHDWSSRAEGRNFALQI